ELAGVQAGGDDEVAGALRGGGAQDRRRHLVEAQGGHLLADGRDDRGPQQDVAVHALAAQVEEAVLQAPLLVDPVLGVDGERQGGRGAQHLDLTDLDLDLAGRQLGVDVVRAAGDDLAVDPDDRLLGQLVQRLVGLRARPGDELRDAGVVAQIDEEDAAQVAPIVQPATQPDVAADVRGAELAAGVGPVAMHRGSSRLRGSGLCFTRTAPKPTGRSKLSSPRLPLVHACDNSGTVRLNLPKVGQCALVSPCRPWAMSSPLSTPAAGTGTPPRARSRSTPWRLGCSVCPRSRHSSRRPGCGPGCTPSTGTRSPGWSGSPSPRAPWARSASGSWATSGG